MKKSTWFVSLVLVALLGCKSKGETAKKPSENSDSKVENNKGESGISTRENEAIYHSAPNQAEIDSIKNERMKEKRGDD
jgi:uncharacterized protein YcfL